MRKYILLAIFWCVLSNLYSQETGNLISGTVSYVSSQNVYIKFVSTSALENGDTLLMNINGNLTPALIIKEHSSISCVCAPLLSRTFTVGETVFSSSTRTVATAQEQIPVKTVTQKPVPSAKSDSNTLTEQGPEAPRQNINGRVSVSSYSDFSNVSDFSQRMRYNLTMNADHIAQSKFSAETYISFSHYLPTQGELKNNLFEGLKVYTLALKYSISPDHSLWVGRKINGNLSGMGAIDGLQYEFRSKNFYAGAVAGSRPDYIDYRLNINLFQYGGYLGFGHSGKQGMMQTTAAFIEQHNRSAVDRRFAYFQHSNSLLKNLYFFGSAEIDLYKKLLNRSDSSYTQSSGPELTNLYLSLRYRVLKHLSLSFSFSERQNIIYYETYKDIVERLLELSRLQGYSFSVNYRLFKNINIGTNGGYRKMKADSVATKNLYSYVTYNNVPVLKASLTISAALLRTNYLDGNIYGMNLTKDFLKGKLYSGAGYRYINYKYTYTESSLIQHMAEISLSWRLMKNLTLSMNSETTFEKSRTYERLYLNISRRF